MKINTLFLGITSLLLTSLVQAEQKIPMSDNYYQGKYFLISDQKSGNIHTVIYKVNFKTETVFSKMEINCSTGKIRATGEGINSLNNLKNFSDKGSWSSPVAESTRSDVAKFVCRKSR